MADTRVLFILKHRAPGPPGAWTHVIIEAFWVVPDKFDVLKKLHPTVKWLVRNHSKSDFLSHEGGMIGWALDYIKKDIILACNSPEATEDFKHLAVALGADPGNVVFLPNFYKAPTPEHSRDDTNLFKQHRLLGSDILGVAQELFSTSTINVGCFGAIRPLKNQLHQAMGAIIAAKELNCTLNFWINANRVEGKAESILRSIQELFKRFPQHELIEMGWLSHSEFTKVSGRMDILLQVSNSETFNIVAADAVAAGVPVLVSNEIPWLDTEYHANPNDVQDIANNIIKIIRAAKSGMLQADQLFQLRDYAHQSKCIWKDFLQQEKINIYSAVTVL
jgi:glycosyltransferase involved in cell wall biosynthesis